MSFLLLLSGFALLCFSSIQGAPVSNGVREESRNVLEREALLQVIHELEESKKGISENGISWDDDDDVTGRPVFPGVAAIILGTLTGDIRRIIEDGAFSFLSKNNENTALKVFSNLLQKTTPTTTTLTTPKPKILTTKRTTTVEAEDEDGEDVTTGRSSKKPGLNYKFARTTAATTRKTTTPPAETEDEDELAFRFEKALEPYLPSNPDELIPNGIPEFL